jgi:hypothetical protein
VRLSFISLYFVIPLEELPSRNFSSSTAAKDMEGQDIGVVGCIYSWGKKGTTMKGSVPLLCSRLAHFLATFALYFLLRMCRIEHLPDRLYQLIHSRTIRKTRARAPREMAFLLAILAITCQNTAGQDWVSEGPVRTPLKGHVLYVHGWVWMRSSWSGVVSQGL